MKKKENKDIEIIGTIPDGLSIFEAPFGISKGGTICELSFHAQKLGLIVIKREIKNLRAAIRLYLVHVSSYYQTTLMKINESQVVLLGKQEELESYKIQVNKILEELKAKKKPVKELEKVIEEMNELGQRINSMLEEIKRKQIRIKNWALQRATILLKEQARISEILNNFLKEMAMIYALCSKYGLTPNFREFLFSRYYYNLENWVEKLKTIKVRFLDDNSEDLEKIRKIEKYLLYLKELPEQDFIEKTRRIIDLTIPITPGPIEIKIDGNNYLIEWGNVKCISK